MLRLPTPIRITDSLERIALATISRHAGTDDGIIPLAVFKSLPVGAVIEPVLPSLAARGHILLTENNLAHLSRVRQLLKNEKDRNRLRERNGSGVTWFVRDRIAELFPSVRPIAPLPASKPETLPIDLNRALNAENLAFGTYTIMMTVAQFADERGEITIARIAMESGYSPHAVRNQLRRTHWWTVRDGSPLTYVSLTGAAREKLARVQRRIPSANA